MLKLINKVTDSEYLSAFAVIAVAAATGAKAADGMEPLQWLAGVSAILGAIAWAVMVRVWPKAARA